MTEDKSSYKSAFKATSLFGGVQIFNIIIRIIRSKIVAVLLGPSGMGVFGLLYSSVEMISALTNFGLGQSVVKNIAEANGSGNLKKLESVVTVFRRLIRYTALLGTLVCLMFAPYLSQITFGNRDYTFAFAICSISVLLQQLTSGNAAVLQGLQKFKDLAKANVYGSIAGLVITVPLYYFFRQQGIVPVLILSYTISYIVAYLIARKYPVDKVHLTQEEKNNIAKEIIKLGVVMNISGLLSLLTAYLVRVFIRSEGTLDDVGLYNAGFAIINTYVGMVFTAMATEYYPRLASKIGDNKLFLLTIIQQTEIVLLMLIPMVTAFIVFIRPIIFLLYSSKFIQVEGMIYWAIAAMVFKALAWSVSFGLIVKGNMMDFSICEFGSTIYGFVFNIIGYKLYGLDGLGISFFLLYLVYFIHMFITFRKRYHFTYGKVVIKIASFALVIIVLSLAMKLIHNNLISYSLGIVILGAACSYSFIELDKRILFSKLLSNFKKW